jgi:hypothetical protein
MSFTVYTCPEAFVARIPDVLRAEGYVVSVSAPRKNKEAPLIILKKPFAFDVTDGKRIFTVRGSEEKDGITVFAITARFSLNPQRLFGSRRFYDRVAQALMKAGAKVFNPTATQPNP